MKNIVGSNSIESYPAGLQEPQMWMPERRYLGGYKSMSVETLEKFNPFACAADERVQAMKKEKALFLNDQLGDSVVQVALVNRHTKDEQDWLDDLYDHLVDCGFYSPDGAENSAE
ncbi:MAG: hypothetical protein COA42_10970 [Alteromonadaceae bacterium]|nr:MAG: hypothetical protein COA42_10970 [Alteromonadaceae bacterium]